MDPYKDVSWEGWEKVQQWYVVFWEHSKRSLHEHIKLATRLRRRPVENIIQRRPSLLCIASISRMSSCRSSAGPAHVRLAG